MKKFLLPLVAVCLFFTACEKSNEAVAENEIRADKLYFFYSDSCPHCHDALRYIKKNHPTLQYDLVNVQNRDGYNLFLKCARKFKLGNEIGTPLFCMGSHYLMGWSPRYEVLFDQYAQPFIK